MPIPKDFRNSNRFSISTGLLISAVCKDRDERLDHIGIELYQRLEGFPGALRGQEGLQVVQRHVRVGRGCDLVEQRGKNIIEQLAAPRRLVDKSRAFAQHQQVAVCLAGVAEPEPFKSSDGFLLRDRFIEQQIILMHCRLRRRVLAGERKEIVVDAPDPARMFGIIAEQQLRFVPGLKIP